MPLPSPRTLPSTIGRYRVVSYLGGGGMADVFRVARTALDGQFRRELALKRMKVDNDTDPAVFFEEAILSSQLTHPNIVQGFDFGEHEGTYYLVMELIEGVHLGELARYVKQTESGPLPPRLVVHVAMKLCSALEYAHGEPHRVIHRDISPHNVLLSVHGEVKLIDFGIAKFATRGHHTRTNQVRGKIAYMSPEQVEDRPLDHRSDLFALGIVLYEILSGERPFRSSTDRLIMKKIATCEYAPLDEVVPHLDPMLVNVVHQLLALDPAGRPESAREVRQTLEQLVEPGTDPVSEIAGFVRRAQRARADDPTSPSAAKFSSRDKGAWPSVSVVQGPVDEDLDEDFDGDLDPSELATDQQRMIRDLANLSSQELRARAFSASPPLLETSDSVESSQPFPAPSPAGHPAPPAPNRPRRPWLLGLGASIVMTGGLAIALAPKQPMRPLASQTPTPNTAADTAPTLAQGTVPIAPAPPTPPQTETRPGATSGAHPAETQSSNRTAASADERARRASPQKGEDAASLEIVVQPWAHIWLDGEFLGLVDTAIEHLKPGKHKLAIGQHVPQKQFSVLLKPGKNVLRYTLD